MPLGYEFSLYSYGPFDSEVLSDLQTAETLDVLDTEIEYYPGGYKYDIRSGEKAEKAKRFAKEFLETHRDDIGWVASNFAGRSATDLELLSTIVYVNGEQSTDDRDELVEQVQKVKPHFSIDQIQRYVQWLDGKGLLS